MIKVEAQRVIDVVIEAIKEGLTSDGKVNLTSFGYIVLLKYKTASCVSEGTYALANGYRIKDLASRHSKQAKASKKP